MAAELESASPGTMDGPLVLVFTLDERLFSLAVTSVERVVAAVEVTPLPGAPDVVLGVVDVAGALVPVLDLRRRLGVAPREVTVDDQFVLTQTPRGLVAVVVDRVTSVSRLSADAARSLGEACAPVGCVVTALHTAEGLVLALDGDCLLSDVEAAACEAALSGVPFPRGEP